MNIYCDLLKIWSRYCIEDMEIYEFGYCFEDVEIYEFGKSYYILKYMVQDLKKIYCFLDMIELSFILMIVECGYVWSKESNELLLSNISKWVCCFLCTVYILQEKKVNYRERALLLAWCKTNEQIMKMLILCCNQLLHKLMSVPLFHFDFWDFQFLVVHAHIQSIIIHSLGDDSWERTVSGAERNSIKSESKSVLTKWRSILNSLYKGIIRKDIYFLSV